MSDIQTAAVVIGGVAGGLAILGTIARWVRRASASLRHVSEWVDSVRGDPERGVPSMADRVLAIQQQGSKTERLLAEHIRYHPGAAGAANVTWPPPSPNGMPEYPSNPAPLPRRPPCP